MPGMTRPAEDFYIIAREAGAENPAIPTWACHSDNPAKLVEHYRAPVNRVELQDVPGAFQLVNLLSADECGALIKMSEALGYSEDAAVSLPRSVRHNHSFTWVADDATNQIIWERCQALMDDRQQCFGRQQALGLNARFRFYRYQQGDFFAPHTDGAWPGSRVIDNKLVHNAYHDRFSQLSFLIFLSDDFSGGATQFYVKAEDPGRGQATDIVDVRTPLGGALAFPHGMHPLHCLHGSADIISGQKYIIRSDVLFSN
ncbi:MAG: hypothetical protein ACI822_002370 [Gammaproteobacteria bacterium]|jgi:hypothetical protein